MREILFRGQTWEKGEKTNMATGEKIPGPWVYGGIFPVSGDYSIIYGGATKNELEKHIVYSSTVGQYTGLLDKHGKRIFEGDILRGKGVRVFRVDYNDDIAGFVAHAVDGCSPAPCMSTGTMLYYEIVGNIHDNPELLGGGGDG